MAANPGNARRTPVILVSLAYLVGQGAQEQGLLISRGACQGDGVLDTESACQSTPSPQALVLTP